MPQLAAFYIAAQIIERITELASKVWDKPRNEKNDSDLKARAFWLWVVSSALGVALAVGLKLGFFAASGFQGTDPWLDHILSGIALGAGTKPVHDVIAYIEKASEKKGK